MNILAENTLPVILSENEVECVLPFNTENHGALQQGAISTETFFLHFRNIFGSTRCPNYDVFINDNHPHPKLIHLGILSFFGCRARSSDNVQGAAQSFRAGGSAGLLIKETLLNFGKLPLLFIAQEQQTLGNDVVIEQAYLLGDEKR